MAESRSSREENERRVREDQERKQREAQMQSEREAVTVERNLRDSHADQTQAEARARVEAERQDAQHDQSATPPPETNVTPVAPPVLGEAGQPQTPHNVRRLQQELAAIQQEREEENRRKDAALQNMNQELQALRQQLNNEVQARFEAQQGFQQAQAASRMQAANLAATQDELNRVARTTSLSPIDREALEAVGNLRQDIALVHHMASVLTAQGVTYRDHRAEEVPGPDGVQRMVWTGFNRPLRSTDILNIREYDNAYNVVTADGRKYTVPVLM